MNSLDSKKNETSNRIEEVKINITDKTEIYNDKEKISEENIEELKGYFENTYSIEKEQIHINEY